MSDDLKSAAMSRFNQGDFDGALSILGAVVNLDPNDWNALYLLGQCHRFNGNFDEAKRYLVSAGNINSEEAPIWQAIGIIEQKTGNFPAAISAFKRAVKINPNAELAYNSLALTHKLAGEIELSSETYEKGLQALSRNIVIRMKNDEKNQINKHVDFGHGVWLNYAMYGYLSCDA
jgi:tetratricopeptide (TPR) repeat protein